MARSCTVQKQNQFCTKTEKSKFT